jgi:uncharacterized DUF497 family protein
VALTFEWDSGKAESNASKHGVTFEEAGTVFADLNAITISDPAHSSDEAREITIGYSLKRKLLVVVHTKRSDNIRVISARSASRRERRSYEEKIEESES